MSRYPVHGTGGRLSALRASVVLAVAVLTALAVASPTWAEPASQPSGPEHSSGQAAGELEGKIVQGQLRRSAFLAGQAAVLVPATYPVEISGRQVRGRVAIRFRGGGKAVRTWTDRPHKGSMVTADRRSNFRFVHAVPLGESLSRRLARNPARVNLRSTISVTLGDGDSRYRGVRIQPRLRKARPDFCSSGAMILPIRGGTTGRASLPYCGNRLNWRVVRTPDRGTAIRQSPWVHFGAGPSALGAGEFTLLGTGTGGRGPVRRTYQFRIAPSEADSISVRALGDSVTAGFGYFGLTGRPMRLTELLRCRPGETVFNDACSSNSSGTNSAVGSVPDYLPDYGLSRNISWAAQWANQYGITDYRNYAVTGSAPSDWLSGGQFHDTLLSIQEQNPDYIVLTLGANPLLSDVLFGIDTMGCALESDLFGDFRQCVLDAFETVDLDDRLNQVYSSLVANTTSKIVVMQYHLSIPASAIAYSAVQLEVMGDLLNEIISDEAGQVSSERIAVVSPPRFDVGIDMTPVAPADFSCSWLGFEVDGPSVQSDGSQDELLALHPLSFCSGPALGPPWVIDGDTGIHPSAAGYSQMAGQMPVPE